MGQSLVIHGLIKKRAEVAGQHRAAVKAADGIKDDWPLQDRALHLCGYQEDPKAIAPRGKYKQMFGRNELKLAILDTLRKSPADDLAIADAIIEAKGWQVDDALHADILKRVRHAIQRARNSGLIVQDFGPNGCLWKLAP